MAAGKSPKNLNGSANLKQRQRITAKVLTIPKREQHSFNEFVF